VRVARQPDRNVVGGAHESSRAPPVLLAATHERALDLIEIDTLLAYAIEPEGSEPATSGL